MAPDIFDLPLHDIQGRPTTLAPYRGQVLLIVNVASQCGLTPQYAGLQKLHAEKHGLGLSVLGFPANNFGGQEPGSNGEIAAFCESKFSVDFPMFAKISVAGADRHPLYNALIAAQPQAEGTEAMRGKLAAYGIKPGVASEVLWNFEKFVVDRRGRVIARLSPDCAPEDSRLRAVLDGALAAQA